MPPAPVLLALDTATARCSVALALHGSIHEIARDVGHGHTEQVLPMVDELLGAHGQRLADCDAVAFGAGPGSFTGLRIACGIAQGLAFGIDRPVVPVSSLEATAWDAFARRPGIERVLVALDARMSEVYWAVYARGEARPAEVAPAALASPAQVLELGERYDVEAIAGSGAALSSDSPGSFRGELMAEASASARGIAWLAVAQFRDGAAVDAALAAPIYVRDRVAFTIEERRALASAPGQA